MGQIKNFKEFITEGGISDAEFADKKNTDFKNIKDFEAHVKKWGAPDQFYLESGNETWIMYSYKKKTKEIYYESEDADYDIIIKFLGDMSDHKNIKVITTEN